MFADALERAINSEQNASDMVDESWAKHPYYDDLDTTATVRDVVERYEYEFEPGLEEETVCDVNVDEMHESDNYPVNKEELVCEASWAEHPYYDALDTYVNVHDVDEMQESTGRDVIARNEYEDEPGLEGETVETVSDVEESWADHPYYDDLDSSVTVCDVDEIQESEDNAHQEEEEPDNELWEDHPYHDTPDELEECGAESDGTACQDSEEEEVAWEDSPYY